MRLPERGATPLHTDAAGTLPPDAFGPFRVLHQVGAGALGPVFRAYDPEHDRLVALKLVRLDMPPERAHALVAELWRVIGAGLTHPILAAPIAAGLADVTPYLAQEFVSADSLDLVVRDFGPPPPAEALRVATQLAGALDFCAAAQVYHGALHPRDVLVSSDDTRLTGVGLAQACEKAGLAPTLRRPYTAPERAAGSPWSRSADVFSLAAVIYEMLTGRRIAGVGERAAGGLGEIPGLNHTALRSVFARALAEGADDRFPSALAFADALREVIPERGAAAVGDGRVSASPVATTPPPVAPVPPPPVTAPVSASPAAEPPPAARVQPRAVNATVPAMKAEAMKTEAVKVEKMRTEAVKVETVKAETRREPIVEEELRLPLDAEPIPDEIDRRLAAPSSPPVIDDLDLAPAVVNGATDDTLNRFDDVLLERELEEVKQMVAPEIPAEPVIPDAVVLEPPPVMPMAREARAAPIAAVKIPPTPKPEPRPHVDPAFAASSLTLERGESVPSRSVLPFLLTLLLGVAIGFAGGYAVGGRDMSVADTMAARTETAATAGSTGTPAAPPQEFTESAIREVPPDTRAGSAVPATADAAVPTDAKPPAAAPAPAPAPAPRTETAPRPAAAPPNGRLLIRSTPSGARVTIDGRDAGRTPVTERSVTLGAHTIRVIHDGYVAEERRVTMTAARPSQTLAFELDRVKTPARGETTASRPPGGATPGTAGRYTGALLVESRPTAASVYVDGKLAGTTPVSVESLDAGEHLVHLEMDGYRRWSRSVRIVAGERNKVTASLER